MSTKGAPSLHKFWLALVIAIGAFCAEPGQALAGYIQTNLVSDIPGLATITDSSLVNPWGFRVPPRAPSGFRTKGQI